MSTSPLESPVSSYMTQPVAYVAIEDDVARADEILRELGISALLVVGADGTAVGVISRRDLLRAGRVIAHARSRSGFALLHLPAMAAADLMHRPVVGVSVDATVTEACRVLVDHRIHRVFVLDGGKPVGVFSTREVMAAARDARIATPIAEVMSRPVVSVATTAPVVDALTEAERAGVAGVLVTEDDLVVGLLTEVELLAARALPPETPAEEVMTQALLCLPARTPLFRAAGFALATRARRIAATSNRRVQGVVTGIDFARLIAG